MTQKKRAFEESEDSDALVNDSAFEDDEIYQKECGRDALEENYADIETQKPVIRYQSFIEFFIFIICISLTLTQSFRIVFIVFEFTVGLMNMKVTTSCTLSLITFTNSIEIEIKIFLPSILHMRQSTHKWTKSNLRKTDI